MNKFIRYLAIDLRSLAVLRMGLGLILLWNAWVLSHHATEWFSDDGICPRSVTGGWALSLFSLSGSATWAATLFCINAIGAALLVLGLFTWTATLLCFALMWSLTNRNPFVCGGGVEMLLCWILFWCLFLPTGAVWSFDARIRKRKSAPANTSTRRTHAGYSFASIATAAMLMQISFVYWSTMRARVNNSQWRDLSAVHYYLHSNAATPLGTLVAAKHAVTICFSALTLVCESICPVLALLTARIPWLRAIIVAMMMLLHAGISLMMYVGITSVGMIVVWSAFIPGAVWDALARTRSGDSTASARDTLGLRELVKARRRVAPWYTSRALAAVCGAALAYTVLVNLQSMSNTLARITPTLPKLKQRWQFMTGVPLYDKRSSVEARLSDGKTVVLTSTPDDAPSTLRNLLWPPDQTQRRGALSYAVDAAVEGNRSVAAALCDYQRSQWEAAHPEPGARVQSLRLIAVWRALPPLHNTPADIDRMLTAKQFKPVTLYEWKAPSAPRTAAPPRG